MADGETHLKYLKLGWYIIIPLGVLLMGIMYVVGEKNSYLYPFFLYLNFLLCEIIDPDNDLMGLTSAEGRILRFTKKYYLGFFGALCVAYGFIYAYIIGLFGGHRSVVSHGVGIGTMGRMIFYNIPVFLILWGVYSYGLVNWGWIPSISLYKSFAMEKWFSQYIISQFSAWFIGDGIHLILDSQWAKGRLYQPKNKRNDE